MPRSGNCLLNDLRASRRLLPSSEALGLWERSRWICTSTCNYSWDDNAFTREGRQKRKKINHCWITITECPANYLCWREKRNYHAFNPPTSTLFEDNGRWTEKGTNLGGIAWKESKAAKLLVKLSHKFSGCLKAISEWMLALIHRYRQTYWQKVGKTTTEHWCKRHFRIIM